MKRFSLIWSEYLVGHGWLNLQTLIQSAFKSFKMLLKPHPFPEEETSFYRHFKCIGYGLYKDDWRYALFRNKNCTFAVKLKKSIVMLNSLFSEEEKYLVHFKQLFFGPLKNQVIYYDPQPSSECSKYIKSHMKSIKAFLKKQNYAYEFCYLPEMVGQLTEEQVRYRFPNWNGEPLQTVGNDILKPLLSEKDKDIKACFLHLLTLTLFNNNFLTH